MLPRRPAMRFVKICEARLESASDPDQVAITGAAPFRAPRRALGPPQHLLVRLKLGGLNQVFRLIFFPQKTVPNRQHFDLSSEKTPERIFRRADNRLASHVETGIHQHRAPGAMLEGAQQGVEAWILFLVYSLDARGVVDVRHCRYLAPENVGNK